jgi:hypothetical protein
MLLVCKFTNFMSPYPAFFVKPTTLSNNFLLVTLLNFRLTFFFLIFSHFLDASIIIFWNSFTQLLTPFMSLEKFEFMSWFSFSWISGDFKACLKLVLEFCDHSNWSGNLCKGDWGWLFLSIFIVFWTSIHSMFWLWSDKYVGGLTTKYLAFWKIFWSHIIQHLYHLFHEKWVYLMSLLWFYHLEFSCQYFCIYWLIVSIYISVKIFSVLRL